VCGGVLEDDVLDGLNLPAKVIAYIREHHRFPPIED
jgi:hypothetical protein